MAGLLDPRTGSIQQKTTGGPFGCSCSWSQRGHSATVKDALQAEKDEENHLNFFIPLLSSVIAGPDMVGT